jgi:hypothetical protein
MDSKRGISAVVATVLIILIVVVGVGIVWKVVLPIFSEIEYLSYSDVRLNIVFQGYTVYDSDKHFALVQISRGEDDVNLTGLEIGFSFNGTSKTYQTMNVPEPNGKYTYKFNFTNDSLPHGAPDTITVAPIFLRNNKLKLGKILDTEDMPVGTIRLSSGEWEDAGEEATQNILVIHQGCSDCPGVPVDPVDPPVECAAGEIEYDGGCAIEITSSGPFNLDQEGRAYVLTEGLTQGFIISAKDVTLDGNGKTITGAGFNDDGVYAEGLTGITIKNFGKMDNFWVGVRFIDVNDSFIENNFVTMEISSYATGVFIINSNGNEIFDNEFYCNSTSAKSYGVYLKAEAGKQSNGNEILDNEIFSRSTSTRANGVYIQSPITANASENVIEGNSITVDSTSEAYGVYAKVEEFNSNQISSNVMDVVGQSQAHGIFIGEVGMINNNIIELNKMSVEGAFPGTAGISLTNYGGSMESNHINKNNISIYGKGIVDTGVSLYARYSVNMNDNEINYNIVDGSSSSSIIGLYVFSGETPFSGTNITGNEVCDLTSGNLRSFSCFGGSGFTGDGNQFAGTVERCSSWPTLVDDYTVC